MEEKETEKTEQPAKKKKPILAIIISAAIIILLIVVGAIVWIVSSQSPQTPSKETPKEVSKNVRKPSAIGSDFSNIGPMYPLDTFTMNLLNESGSRYIKCTIQLEQDSELLKTELDKKSPIIRDIIISILTSKTFEEISTARGKEKLKEELAAKINEILTDGFIKNVYFTDFVIS